MLDALEGGAGGGARGGGRRRPPRGARARDRRAWAHRPRAHARPRGRGDEAAAASERVGEPHRLIGRGLVPDGDGGRGLRHAERGAGGGRPARVDRGRATGLLARDPEELVEQTRRVVRDPELRERLGAAALERARAFSWDRTAQQTLDALERERQASSEEPGSALRRVRRQIAGSDTGRAAGLGAAVMGSNLIALIFTVVFGRLLHSSGYGSLATLVAAFVILQVPGSALQATVAREVSAEVAAGDRAPGARYPELDGAAPGRVRRDDRDLDSARRRDRLGRGRGQRALGRRGDGADRGPVADPVGRARRPSGLPALQAGGQQRDRRGHHAPVVGTGDVRHRARRDGRLPRHGAVAWDHRAALGLPAARRGRSGGRGPNGGPRARVARSAAARRHSRASRSR